MTFRAIDYVADSQGIVLFAADRATLLRGCPEHRAVILDAIDREDAGRPCWLAALFDDEETVAAGVNAITDGQPTWWFARQASR